MKKILLIVDVQNDFFPGGPLAVKNADEVIEPINNLVNAEMFEMIIYTHDWHPANHSSFVSNDSENGIWPDHAVQNTDGAKLQGDLVEAKKSFHLYKGTNPEVDSYSAFYDNDHKTKTELVSLLKYEEPDEVFVCGLATDYCIKFTVLDSLAEGWNTILVTDAVRGVNINPKDSEKAIDEMVEAGANVIDSEALL